MTDFLADCLYWLCTWLLTLSVLALAAGILGLILMMLVTAKSALSEFLMDEDEQANSWQRPEKRYFGKSGFQWVSLILALLTFGVIGTAIMSLIGYALGYTE